MEENMDDVMELYIQAGVLLSSAPASYLTYLNTTGVLYITEYLNSNTKRCIEWKPNDVIADSDTQDIGWNFVNVVERRSRTLSDNAPPDMNRSKYLRISFSDIKSFKVSRPGNKLILIDGKGDILCSFVFQNTNCDSVVTHLKSLLRTAPSKRDRHLFVVLDDHPETQMLNKSFAELNLFQEEPYHIWKFLKNFQESPYAASMEAFAKVADVGNYFWNYYFILLHTGRYYITTCNCIVSCSCLANILSNSIQLSCINDIAQSVYSLSSLSLLYLIIIFLDYFNYSFICM